MSMTDEERSQYMAEEITKLFRPYAHIRHLLCAYGRTAEWTGTTIMLGDVFSARSLNIYSADVIRAWLPDIKRLLDDVRKRAAQGHCDTDEGFEQWLADRRAEDDR